MARRAASCLPSSTSKRRWRGGSWCFRKLDATPLARAREDWWRHRAALLAVESLHGHVEPLTSTLGMVTLLDHLHVAHEGEQCLLHDRVELHAVALLGETLPQNGLTGSHDPHATLEQKHKSTRPCASTPRSRSLTREAPAVGFVKQIPQSNIGPLRKVMARRLNRADGHVATPAGMCPVRLSVTRRGG